jgi:signal transduction histidine kinase
LKKVALEISISDEILMKQPNPQSYRWVQPLAAVFLYTAVCLRGVIIFSHSSYLVWIVTILFIWLALVVSEATISQRFQRYFPFYIACQTLLVFILLLMPDLPDFFAALFMVLGMQVMQRCSLRIGTGWIGLCAVGMGIIFTLDSSIDAMALTLVYTGGIVLLGFYARTTRRAQDARRSIQQLTQQLQAANDQLSAYSTQLEQLSMARERSRLARDLHDSVTQTVFSMSLTAQSAGLLLERSPDQAQAQLERLEKLTHSALSEMKQIVSELHPAEIGEGGLISALRKYLQEHLFPKELAITFQSEGQGFLGDIEEESLFYIIREALNNIEKHSQASQAILRVHLAEPFWIEVQDNGKGFNLTQALIGGSVGLKSMQERAAEIGWELRIVTSLGSGTRVRVEKVNSAGGRYDRKSD